MTPNCLLCDYEFKDGDTVVQFNYGTYGKLRLLNDGTPDEWGFLETQQLVLYGTLKYLGVTLCPKCAHLKIEDGVGKFTDL